MSTDTFTATDHGLPSHYSFAQAEISKVHASLERLERSGVLAQLVALAETTAARLAEGGKVLFFGNGGSAADAQHLAAELVGRQNYDRPPTAGLALTVDTSALTAIANDYGYDQVFSRQVEALGREGDIAWGISTSGRSTNVVRGLLAGRQCGLLTVAFTGADPRLMRSADYVVAVPAEETAKIQELQMICGHVTLAIVEQILFPPPQ